MMFKYFFIFLFSLTIIASSCSMQQDVAELDDPAYFTKADFIKKDNAVKARQQSLANKAKQSSTSSSKSEDEYFDEDYDPYQNAGFSPYQSPIYDPFWGPPNAFSNPFPGSMNPQLGLGYNNMWGPTVSLGMQYGMGANPWGMNQWGAYPSFYNPYYPMGMNPYMGFNNPYGGWGQPMMGGGAIFMSQPPESRRPTSYGPRNNRNEYRSNAVNRQFYQNNARKNSQASPVRPQPQRPYKQNFNNKPQRQRPIDKFEEQRSRPTPNRSFEFSQPQRSTPTRTAPARTSPSRSTSPSRRRY